MILLQHQNYVVSEVLPRASPDLIWRAFEIRSLYRSQHALKPVFVNVVKSPKQEKRNAVALCVGKKDEPVFSDNDYVIRE